VMGGLIDGLNVEGRWLEVYCVGSEKKFVLWGVWVERVRVLGRRRVLIVGSWLLLHGLEEVMRGGGKFCGEEVKRDAGWGQVVQLL